MRRLTPLSVLGAMTLVVVVGACGSDTGSGNGGAPPASYVAPTEGSEVLTLLSIPPGATPSVLTIDVHKGAIGTYLVGQGGMSLYVRTSDSKDNSTCTGSCASTWPPVTIGSGGTVKAGTGVTGKLGSFKRPDGSTQVTLDGLPLYYFSGDTAAGQTTGQGVQGIWFLAAASGGHLTGGAAPAASSGSGW